jgi:hypothetical protein
MATNVTPGVKLAILPNEIFCHFGNTQHATSGKEHVGLLHKLTAQYKLPILLQSVPSSWVWCQVLDSDPQQKIYLKNKAQYLK